MQDFFVANLTLPQSDWLRQEEALSDILSNHPDHRVSIGYNHAGDNVVVEIIFSAADKKILPENLLSAVTIKPLAEKNWLVEQRRDFAPITIAAGKNNQHYRWWIADSDYRDAANLPPYPTKKLLIDISQAFGTGRHGTTQLCMDMLAQLPPNHRRHKKLRILDVGTGTGILGLAAKQVYRRATITLADNDAVAINIARANARRNRLAVKKNILGDGLKCFYKPPRNLAPYDLIFANIVFIPLWRLAMAIARASRGHGFVILSGITVAQENTIQRRYEQVGFLLQHRKQQGDWVSLLFKKTTSKQSKKN
ncbi:MAG: 50S ribosomal protein L11 methyltransferase [Hydrotalea sp.]|nr:50S ribosomal protein L11 methyltransferase [Hydrotalea sp.]